MNRARKAKEMGKSNRQNVHWMEMEGHGGHGRKRHTEHNDEFDEKEFNPNRLSVLNVDDIVEEEEDRKE